MALVCELCEGTSFVKEDGMFVCQGCGTKYSIEEAKKMMTGAPAAPSAAQSGKVENFLTLAVNAFDASNNSEAEGYASKVLEIDANNAKAWLIKGSAIGWQSKVANVRFDEMINCWGHCLENASEDELEGFREHMKEQATNLIKALTNVNADNFGDNPVENNKVRLKNCAQNMLSTVSSLIPKFVFLDLDDISQHLAVKMNSAGVSGSDEADKDYGPERSDKHIYAYRRWIEKYDNCIEVLELALRLAKKESTIKQIQKNLEILQNNMINSCCYKFEANGYTSGYYEDQSLTTTAKNYRRNKIKEYENTAKEKLDELKEKERKKQEERNKKYWEAHAEQKQELEAKKKELRESIDALQKQIKPLEKELESITKKGEAKVPAEVETEQLHQQAAALEKEKSSLGLFKGKEKKALQAQIDELYLKAAGLKETVAQQQKAQKAAVDAEAKPIREKLDALKRQKATQEKELERVNNELTKNR